MKYFNVLIFLTFISVCQAQIDNRPFYYYFDEKVLIDIDSSNAILVIGDLKSKEDLLRLVQKYGALHKPQNPYQNILNITFGSSNNNKNFERQLKEEFPDVFFSFSYKYQNAYVLVLNEVSLKPKHL